MKTFPTRNNLLSYFGPNQIICEIGVFKGEFSDFLFSLSPKELILIDIFEGITHSGDKDGENIKYADLSECYENLIEKYKNHNNVKIYKGKSEDILSNSIKNGYFDVMYIDGCHTYRAVKRDLELGYQKVKENGKILGHDFNLPGVFRAVTEFCAEKRLEISYLTEDKCPSFGLDKLEKY
jgi:hypothetical protein